MRQGVRRSAVRAIRWSGVTSAVHSFHRRRQAAILFYHDPKPDVFDAHLVWLARRFAFTTLDAIVDALHGGDWSGVPERAVAFTFDDGHRGNHALLPVLRRHGVVPTIYLCSQVVATRRRFWFQQPGWRPGIEAEPYKRLSNAARVEALAKDLEFHPQREYPADERQALSKEEIAEMAPYVDFEVHTRFHPVLTQCTDAEAWDEIATSKQEIEALLGRPCRHFSYPNGDYRDREATLARHAGFASARTVDLGWTHAGSDPYRLKSFGINDDASIDMLATQLSGIPGYVRRLMQGSRGGRWPAITPGP